MTEYLWHFVSKELARYLWLNERTYFVGRKKQVIAKCKEL